MSSYNTKNYAAHGGNEWVIGGKLTFQPDAEVEGLTDLLGLPDGGVTPAANQEASVATTVAGLKDDLNALLTKLKAAGVMTADTPPDETQEE